MLFFGMLLVLLGILFFLILVLVLLGFGWVCFELLENWEIFFSIDFGEGSMEELFEEIGENCID